jgi:hypothetical protein
VSTDKCQLKNAPKAMTWEIAIVDAKNKIRELRDSIRFFERKRKAGEPFPLQSSRRNSDQQHSVEDTTGGWIKCRAALAATQSGPVQPCGRFSGQSFFHSTTFEPAAVDLRYWGQASESCKPVAQSANAQPKQRAKPCASWSRSLPQRWPSKRPVLRCRLL